MRLFLLPVSTRRTLMYAQRLDAAGAGDRSAVDRAATWAARKWAAWEKRPAGWQRRVVDYGNQAFRRIPFEEWGLKSVPPLSARRRIDELAGTDRVALVFPGRAMAAAEAEALALRLATERQGLHRRKMLWCFAGMPVTLPFALVPVIPNLPFFYLVYRAWSHWRAMAGGRHVEWLVENKLLLPSPSATLDKLYGRDAPRRPSDSETMLLTQGQVRDFSETLDIPALAIELERAIWQVERALERQQGEQGRRGQQGDETGRRDKADPRGEQGRQGNETGRRDKADPRRQATKPPDKRE